MKTKLLFSKQNFNTFWGLLTLCLCFNLGWSQQIIGEFPIMDGGLESQTATTSMSSAGSSQINTPQTTWTVSSQSNSGTRTISDVPADARSGSFSAAFAVLAGKSNVRLQTPSTVSPALQVSTEYTIQFFYKSNTDPGTDLDPGIYLNNTSGGSAGNKTDVTVFAPNTWTKTYETRNTGAIFNASNWAVARISTATSGGYNSIVNIDDFVVYAGAYDDTAPSAATAGSYITNAGTTTISWTAPANATDATNGIISGGYVVVRYASMPAADNDPNQNGVYQLANTITNGTGSLEGTIVYIGSATTFDETYVAGTYYKIYAVDKAFNYSEEITVSDPLLNIAKNNRLDLSVYPNPATDFITIKSNNNQVSSIEVYNLVGKKIITEKNLINSKLDISSLNTGVYILKINGEGRSVNKRIVVE